MIPVTTSDGPLEQNELQEGSNTLQHHAKGLADPFAP